MAFPNSDSPRTRRGAARVARIVIPLVAILVAAAAIFAILENRVGMLALVVPSPILLPTAVPLPPPSPSPTDNPTLAPTYTPTFVPQPTATPSPSSRAVNPTPPQTAQSQPLIFIASEATNSVQVFQGEPPRYVTAIRVGTFPHNISASNDGRYIGVDDRHSDQVSIIDTHTLTEVVRINVGRQPHDLSWAPDDSRIYVTQEKVPFISVIDTATWTTLPPIQLDSPTHDLTLSPDGSQIWATTIRYRGLLIIDRLTGQVRDRLAYFPHGSHDAYFTPNGEVWVTSSGFIENASQVDPNVVIFDAATHRIKMIVPLGEYPFHSVKRYRDGLFMPQGSHVIWFSDRGFGGIIVVSIDTHEVLASIKTGRAPFHLSFGPNGLLYVANHDDWTFSVIDPNTFTVLHTIPTWADPHGIVVVAAPQ
jgi:YVTN family beta-propeller protein